MEWLHILQAFTLFSSAISDKLDNQTTPHDNYNTELCWYEGPFQSLEVCRCLCLDRKQTFCEPTDWQAFYKTVYIAQSEYKIESNGTLLLKDPLVSVSKTQFSNDEYSIFKNNSAVLCFPMDPEFHNCSKITLDYGSFTFLNNRSVRDNHYDRIYPIGLYKKNVNGVEICFDKLPEEEVYTISTPCADGHQFNSLEMCMCYCYFYNVSDVKYCHDFDRSVAAYKSVYVNESEYEIASNGTLILINSLKESSKTHFSRKEYFILNYKEHNSTVLCYPLNPKFHNCTQNSVFLDEFYITNNKSAYVTVYNKVYTIDMYVKNYEGTLSICKNEKHHTILNILFIAEIFSAVCLLVTFILVVLLLNRHSNFALFCYMAMLFSSSTTSVIFRRKSPENDKYNCPLLPLLIQFFTLSAFFWMNVHFYSIYSTFTQLKPPLHQFTVKYQLIRFFCGWGIPLIVTAITVTMDLINVPYVRPKLTEKCGFGVNGISYLYLHGFVCISLFMNLLFLIGIVIAVNKQAKAASSVNRKAYKQMFVLAVKLITISGFCYITNLIFWGVGVWGGFWEYLNVITALQGVYVFIVYICNARALKLFVKKCKICLKLKHKITSTSSTTTVMSNDCKVTSL